MYSYVLLEFLLWLWTLFLFSDKFEKNESLLFFKPKTEYDKFLLGVMTINHGALANSFGHELIHKKDWLSKFIGASVFAKMFYSIYIEQHVRVHHRKVGTPEDSSTARKNENVCSFFVRSVVSSHQKVWQFIGSKIILY